MLADRHCIASGGRDAPQLSAQSLVNCDGRDGGCDGGFLDNAWRFLEKRGVQVSGGGRGRTACRALACVRGRGRACLLNASGCFCSLLLASARFCSLLFASARFCSLLLACGRFWSLPIASDRFRSLLAAQEEACVPYEHCPNPSLPNCSIGPVHIDDFLASPPAPMPASPHDLDEPPSPAPPPTPRPSPAPPPAPPDTAGNCSQCDDGAASTLYRAASAYAVAAAGDAEGMQRELMAFGPIAVGFFVYSDFAQVLAFRGPHDCV